MSKLAFGKDKAAHAAMILSMANNWSQYTQLHHNQLIEAGRNPYVTLDTEGKIIGNSAEPKMAHNAGASVRHEDFLTIRDKITEVRRRELNGVMDIFNRGLTFPASITDQLVGFETVNEFGEAKLEMNPQTTDNQDTEFGEDFLPLPVAHQTFSVPWRQEGFNYKRSLGLSESTRQVSETLENMLFNGSSISVSYNGVAQSIYGYTNHPDRGTKTISDWTNPANADSIVNEIIDAIGQMYASQGGVANDSVVLYVSTTIWNSFQKDYNSGFPSKTIMRRVKDIAQIVDVKPAEKLTVTTDAVLVEMTDRTIEMAVASDIIAVPHTKVSPIAPQPITTYASMVHKIKSDYKGNTGVMHLSVA